MNITELIRELETILEDEGDIPIVTYNSKEECVDAEKVTVAINPFPYYGNHKHKNVILLV